MQAKGEDYAPKGIAVSEAFWTAAETNTTPELSIYNAMRKHWGAVQTAVKKRNGVLQAESIHSHLIDIANFAVLMDFIITRKPDFYRAIEQWTLDHVCVCQLGDGPCEVCTMKSYLHNKELEG